MAILMDIRQKLVTLAAPPALPVIQPAAQVVPPNALQGPGSTTAQVVTQDATTQVLLLAAQSLASLEAPPTPVPPTALQATTDRLTDTVEELKRQIKAIVASHSVKPSATMTAGPSVIPSPGVQAHIPNNFDKGAGLGLTVSHTGTAGNDAELVAPEEVLKMGTG
ncbi:hypothetical protein NDU88_005256 [Pleurodeles waltl]|uniref:Uncharacterized protein n=1 Tax=Pleurodeles waltl TaxID=8319 RepID=A0AAV7SLC8_PLEWA|nr:hypothetical protein NDU88_005256 [Pleurodeles waltl]